MILKHVLKKFVDIPEMSIYTIIT